MDTACSAALTAPLALEVIIIHREEEAALWGSAVHSQIDVSFGTVSEKGRGNSPSDHDGVV